MSYMISAPLPVIVVFYYMVGEEFQLYLVILVPLYTIFLVLAFFLPVSSAHSAMRRAKNKELDYFSNSFNNLHNRLLHMQDKIGEQFDEERKSISEQLQGIYELYHTAKAMPVWPLDFPTIRRFLSVILIPFAVFLVKLATNTESVIFHADMVKAFLHGTSSYHTCPKQDFIWTAY